MECADIISIVKDIVIAVSAGTVAVLALLGLQAWKRELTGKARFETANHMWQLGSEFSARLTGVRLYPTSSVEWADRERQNEETAPASEILNEWHAREKRLNSIRESLDKIIQVQWEAELLLSESSVRSVKEVVQSYRKIYYDIASALTVFFEIRLSEVKTGVPCTDQKGMRETKNIIYFRTNDDVSREVKDATDKLASSLKQYVK